MPADTARFTAPYAIAVTGPDCFVWVADSASGAWRVPCDGSATVRVTDADTSGVRAPATLSARPSAEQVLHGITLPLPTGTQSEMIVQDESADAAWVLLAGARGVPRTWLFCTLSATSVCRSLVVPHQGDVVGAAFHASAVYAIERLADGMLRIAKYGAP